MSRAYPGPHVFGKGRIKIISLCRQLENFESSMRISRDRGSLFKSAPEGNSNPVVSLG